MYNQKLYELCWTVSFREEDTPSYVLTVNFSCSWDVLMCWCGKFYEIWSLSLYDQWYTVNRQVRLCVFSAPSPNGTRAVVLFLVSLHCDLQVRKKNKTPPIVNTGTGCRQKHCNWRYDSDHVLLWCNLDRPVTGSNGNSNDIFKVLKLVYRTVLSPSFICLRTFTLLLPNR